jgi:hypothetical protein
MGYYDFELCADYDDYLGDVTLMVTSDLDQAPNDESFGV